MDDITNLALMIGAIGAAIGAIALVVRLLIRVPRIIDRWAADKAIKVKENAALDCLISMTPTLSTITEQLQPNGGQSLYDLVHQNDASLSEIKLWAIDHAEGHEVNEDKISNWSDQLATMHLMIEKIWIAKDDNG